MLVTPKAILSAGKAASVSAGPAHRLQWVGNGLTLFTADDYNSKVLSERGAAPANVSPAIQKQARGLHPTESPRIT